MGATQLDVVLFVSSDVEIFFLSPPPAAGLQQRVGRIAFALFSCVNDLANIVCGVYRYSFTGYAIWSELKFNGE
jgi:hypothetical protein